MYTEHVEEQKKVVRKSVNEENSIDVPECLKLELKPSLARTNIFNQSAEMLKAVFFYHESNPHVGMIDNIRICLYDTYQLVGPVKKSWFNILQHDQELLNLLTVQIRSEELKQASLTKEQKVESKTQDLSIGIVEVAALLNNLESKREISYSKYENNVTDNVILFDHKKLSLQELATLQVLAQYAFYPYELV
jgi:hypothetical protein